MIKAKWCGLPKTKSQQGRKCDEKWRVHICIGKECKKIRRVMMRKVEKQDPFQFVSV